ncbi:MAG TPA: MarR family winged helix-turn-helix transcriptional regulator [Balneolales bacterium]|nr:MarR family winged helix-turn-helix transcriptional regulator [Balneolales bacterium]
MNRRYDLLKEVIQLIGQFEEESAGDKFDLLSFTLWLNAYLDSQGYPVKPGKEKVTDSKQILGFDYTMEAKISTLLTGLFKYAKHYTKYALDGSPLVTMDDFGFLASLAYRDSMTKTELCNHNLLEITSGSEIIKRLLKNGLIEEYQDPDDKRSKRVKITEEGKKLLMTTFTKMDKVSRIVSGNLRTDEKIELLTILNKLDDFHKDIHNNDWRSDVDEISSKYLNDRPKN